MPEWMGTVLLSVFTGSICSLCVQLFLSNYNDKQSKKRAQWDQLHKRVDDLKEVTGYLNEHLSRWSEGDRAKLVEYFRSLDDSLGYFSQYDDIRRKINDFQNSTGWMFSERGKFELEERERVVSEINERFKILVDSLDRLLDGKRSRPSKLQIS